MKIQRGMAGVRLGFGVKKAMTQSSHFRQCRHNMIESQIRTGGVVNPAVVAAFDAVPRERFAMAGQEGIAYGDEDLPLGAGRWLMEPLTQSRLVQAALPGASETCLVVGGATGYAAAILSRLARAVVMLESDQGLITHARKAWDDLGYTNITSAQGDLAEGVRAHAPYDLIVVDGGVSYVPDSLLSQLSIGGRLVAVVNGRADCTMGQARIIYRTSEDGYSERTLFDAAVPCLPEFSPRREFAF